MPNPEGSYWDVKLTYWVCIDGQVDEEQAIAMAIAQLGDGFADFDPDVETILEEQ